MGISRYISKDRVYSDGEALLIRISSDMSEGFHQIFVSVVQADRLQDIIVLETAGGYSPIVTNWDISELKADCYELIEVFESYDKFVDKYPELLI